MARHSQAWIESIEFSGLLNDKKNGFQNSTLGFTWLMFKIIAEQGVLGIHLSKKCLETGLEGNSAGG